MKFAARIISGFFLIVFFLLIVTAKANAQTIPTNTNPDVPNNLHTFTQSLLIEVASSLTCLTAGVDPVDPKGQCLGIDLQTHKIGYVQNGGGAIGTMGGLIAMTFTPPAHTGDFVRYLSRNFGIIKPAYADNGIGFTGLSPLLNIWTVFRNITYLLFVIVFIVIGFAIMFRVHIDPRTVMTIENQIPKIIVALILVTFSFAIAGFLIDIMYVFMYLAFGIFSQIPGVTGLDTLNPTFLQGHNALEAANGLNAGGGVLGQGGVFGFAMTMTSSVIGVIFNFFGLGGGTGGFLEGSALNGFIHTISGVVGWFTGVQFAQINALEVFGFKIPIEASAAPFIGVATTAATEVFLRNLLPNLIVYLVITIAMIFALIRLWFTLIQAYVFLLIDVIFAPFWIIAGLIPGGNISFVGWLRETGAEIIAFPATLIMFLLGKVLIDAFAKSAPGQFFVPPFIGDPGSPNLMGSLIGFGIILMTPNVVNMMKGWVKAPKFDISAISQAIGVGTGANPMNLMGKAGQMGMSWHYATQMGPLKGALGWIGAGGAKTKTVDRSHETV